MSSRQGCRAIWTKATDRAADEADPAIAETEAEGIALADDVMTQNAWRRGPKFFGLWPKPGYGR
jgi:hypothetical protein